jgi:hypothetical protein
MAKSSVTITFNTMPSAGDNISILEGVYGVQMTEWFRTIRTKNGEVELPEFFPDDGVHPDRYIGNVALAYKTAFDLDFNSTKLYEVTFTNGAQYSGLGTVTITATKSNAVFSVITNSTGADIVINNESESESIKIINTTWQEDATDPCNFVELLCETNVLATKVNGVANTDNPFTKRYLRTYKGKLNLEDAQGFTTYKYLSAPYKLNEALLDIKVLLAPTGATVTIETPQFDGLDLQYSLDNSNWQTSNKYSGIAPGNYTLYAKDQLGCSAQKDFLVLEYSETGSGVNTNKPYAPLPSKANSIRFKKDEVWDDCNIYKTDENTLSCEVDVPIPYREIQRFQTCDSETIQFRTNYEQSDVTVTDQNDQISVIPVFKMSNFMGLKDSRDAFIYDIGDGKAGVYFIAGDTYDYVNGATIGSYTLNGGLPVWGRIGNYLEIDGAYYQIENIVFDEIKSIEALVISNSGVTTETQIIVKCIYNLFNYEVYEAPVDFSTYLDKQLQVKIVHTDARFPDVTFLSERIDVRQRHEGTAEIVYYNEDNTDILFGTGIKFKLRIPLIRVKGVFEDETSIHKTDVDAVMLKSMSYEGDQFEFEPMTKELWRKVQIALRHAFVKINGQGYVLSETGFEFDGPLDDSNLYALKATMLKTDKVFSSNTEGTVYLDGSELEIPGVISSGSNSDSVGY